MRKHWTIVFAMLVFSAAVVFTSSAFGSTGLLQGDLLVGQYVNAATFEYSPTGGAVQTYNGSSQFVATNSVVTPAGTLAVALGDSSSNSAPIIQIFNAQGSAISSVALGFPAVSLPQVACFPDGTLVADAYNSTAVQEIGNQISRSFTAPFGAGLGIGVDAHLNELLMTTQPTAQTAQFDYFSEAGVLVSSFSESFISEELAISPADDSIWALDSNGAVHHLTSKGTELSHFNSAFNANQLPRGLALSTDGQSLYVSALDDTTSVLQYNIAGIQTGSVSINQSEGGMLTIVPEPTGIIAVIAITLVATSRRASKA